MQSVAGSTPRPVEVHEHLTGALWRRSRDRAEVLRFHDGDRWVAMSWSELAARVRAVAAGLIASDVRPGDPIGIMSPTRPEWTIADLAILASGAITVPIYETDSPERCARVLGNTGARLVLAGSTALADRVTAARQEVGAPDELLVLDEGGLDELAARGGDGALAELERRLAALTGDAIASIVHTSGTTGRPKGCILSHHNLLWTTRQALDAVEDAFGRDRPSTLLFLPLAHVFARIIQFAGLETGAVLGYARSRQHLGDDLQAVRPRFLLGAPRAFEKIHETAAEQASGIAGRVFHLAEEVAHDLTTEDPGPIVRLRFAVADLLVYRRVRNSLGGQVRYALSGGGPIDEELVHFLNASGLTLLQGYGLTETSAPVTLDRPGDPRVGTVGRPLPGVEVGIDDRGEVLVRGPNVFQGYHGDPEATAEAFDEEGWLHTGDLGELDADGHLRITGRRKELLVTAGGKNVAPEPLEEELRAHPLIAEPVVIGEGRPFIAALITLDPERLDRFAREHDLEAGDGRLHEHERVREEISRAVEQVNRRVSRAESIREFRILERTFRLEQDELTPTHKPRRATILEHFSDVVDEIYGDEATGRDA